MSSAMWTVKHAPKTLEEFVGNRQAKTEFIGWLSKWTPKSRWALLIGPTGVGKTTLVYLAAKTFGMDVIEVNRENIGIGVSVEQLSESVSTTATLFGESRKLVLIEEVEVTLSAYTDTERLFEVLKNSRVPVVFTMNDQDALYSNRKLFPLRQEWCKQIKFERVRTDQIQSCLGKICRLEGIGVEQEVLKDIAENSIGDLRAAINDLQAVCTGEQVVRSTDINWVTRRDTQIYAYKSVLDLIRSQSIYTAKNIIENTVADWDTIYAWLVENLPAYPKSFEEIYACCEALSVASIYAYRAERFRIYEQKKFAEDFVCYAPQLLGERPFRKLEFPLRLKYLSRSREMRMKLNSLSAALSVYLHKSENGLNDSDTPYIALFAGASKIFYEWFERRFGPEAAKTLVELLKAR
ncbi:MAG: AAA family ATPase [Thermoprotei archaeon]